jgi:leucyl-tRNA---protein transferase
MLEEARLLHSVKGLMLDRYLAAGWYRGGNCVFTTHFVPFADGPIHRVFWLRYLVNKVTLNAKNTKLLHQNSIFETRILKFALTDELAALHQRYVASVGFRTAPTLPDLLVDVDNQIFSSKLVEVRHDGRLVAAGVLDTGWDSAAGIVNIYEPDYKKYSLGRYIMLLKHQYCLAKKIPYYYPGYFSPTYPQFDYKLFLDKAATEVLLPELNDWIPYATFEKLAQ